MADNSVGHAVTLAKSRRFILEALAARGFDVSPFTGFSVSSVHKMFVADDLDMLVLHKEHGNKVLVKFSRVTAMRAAQIQNDVEDYFAYDATLGKQDELIIVSKDPPNDSVKKALQAAWSQYGALVTVIPIGLLQFSVLDHCLVPPHFVLSKEEDELVRKRYNVMDDSQLPSISRFDTVAMLIGLRPGQICRIERPSKTAITTDFYRICSA